LATLQLFLNMCNDLSTKKNRRKLQTIDHKVAPDVFDMPPLLAVAQFPQDNGGRGTERRSCIVALTLMD
jgi:hypothetical protein